MVYLVYFLCNFYLFRLFEVVFMKVIILVFGVIVLRFRFGIILLSRVV